MNKETKNECSLEAEQGRKKKAGRLSRFHMSLIIYSASLLLVAVIGLIVFWSFLASYDKSLPETAVDAYLEDMTEEKWHSLFSEHITYETNDFESPDMLYRRTVSEIVNGKVSYVKDYDADFNTAPAYFLVRDNKKFAHLSLISSDSVGFGFNSWSVYGCSIIGESAVEPFDVTVIAPEDAEVRLNGILLGEKYITETGASSPQMSKYEASNENRPKCTVYTIEGFYAMPQAEVIAEDGALKVTENGTLLSAELPEGTFTSSVLTAPSNAVVTVNGITLKESPAESVPLFFEKYETAEGTGLSLNTYNLTGLLDSPEVTVTLDGATIEPQKTDGGTLFAYPQSALYTATVTVPHGASVTVNGRTLGEDSFKSTGVLNGFDKKAYSHRLTELPYGDVYEISGLYAVPEVKAQLSERELNVITSTEDKVCKFNGDFPSDTTAPEDVSDRALGFAKAFIYYTACGYSNIDTNLASALAFTVSGSEAYKVIADSRIGVMYNSWYALTYNKLEVTGYTAYTDELVRVDVDFDVEKDLGQYHLHDIGSYSIILLRMGDTWYTAEFSMTKDNG